MKNLVDLFYHFISSCRDSCAKPEWFNMGIHESTLEIYTAEEHDDYQYHGDMGRECENKEGVEDFVKSVVSKHRYYKSKEN